MQKVTPTPSDGVPLHRRVVDTLRREIEDGLPAVGERLPTEEALCRRFGVSRHTVRDALRKLREEGLVISRQGAGTTVIRRGDQPLYMQAVSSVEELLQYATEARYEVDKSGMVIADKALARRLGCPPGQRWLRVEGFRYLAGQAEPMCWTEVFILADYAGVGLRIGRSAGPIYSWIEEMYGVRIAEVEQAIRGEPMPAPIRARLGAPAGCTAIGVRRAYRLTNRRLVEVAFNLHRSDRFTYSVTLQRKS
jgi:GntR family transcriptional regulator